MFWLSRNARNRRLVAALLREHPRDKAMEIAAGGDYEGIGKIERALLEQLGLKPNHRVVDVGCGGGRLAFALRDLPGLSYAGFDVVPDLLAYAAARCGRKDWTFDVSDGKTIPLPSGKADFVVFFSVFTHVPERAQLAYLREAGRVVRSGGTIVATFLDAAAPGHNSLAGNWLERARIRVHGHAPNYVTSSAAMLQLGERAGLPARLLDVSPLGQLVCVYTAPA